MVAARARLSAWSGVKYGVPVDRNGARTGAQVVRCGVRIGASCICSKSRPFSFGFRYLKAARWSGLFLRGVSLVAATR